VRDAHGWLSGVGDLWLAVLGHDLSHALALLQVTLLAHKEPQALCGNAHALAQVQV
jgi:hypothetical protein